MRLSNSLARSGAAMVVLCTLGGCGARAESGLDPSTLASGAEFVAIRKALTSEEQAVSHDLSDDLSHDLSRGVSHDGSPGSRASAQSAGRAAASEVRSLPNADGDFYLAIRRSALSQRWFLSANFKQFYPGGPSSFSNSLLGIRVVRFDVQNGKLFVFDASDQHSLSRVEDPTVLVEAYPIVSDPRFDELPHADDYILFDPASGLNQVGFTADTFADPNASLQLPLAVGLSYLQNFRPLRDGIAFEQVFSGLADLTGNGLSERAWGTLGVALRHYHEGEGFVPANDPDANHLLIDSIRLLPDSKGQVALNSTLWNIHRGMSPMKVSIRGGALRAAADFPDADVIGALKRGVEGWNDVFGFPVFKAEVEDTDEVPDEDQLFVMVDYPGSDVGFAFANSQSNPNTGELLAGSVYLSGIFFDVYQLKAAAAPAQEASIASPVRGISWGGMVAAPPLCAYPATRRAVVREPPFTTTAEADRYIQHILTHEFGHVLGLRHNFMGSLQPPSSSVMDYLIDSDRAATPTPQAYDFDAIRYFYGLSDTPPAEPFCTDEDRARDPKCARFDAKRDPLRDFWQSFYIDGLAKIQATGGDATPDDYDSLGLNEILGFARNGEGGDVPSADRDLALQIALQPARIPLSSQDASDPEIVRFANRAADIVLRRAVLDPVEARGASTGNLSDHDVLTTLAVRAGIVARNKDGVRPYELRRTAIDVLHRMQSTSGLDELRRSKQALQDELAQHPPADEEEALSIEDLVARIDAAISPYFD